jgi:hypothetical protein
VFFLTRGCRELTHSLYFLPFQVLTSSILFNLFLQAAAEYPADMVTPMIPVAAVQNSLVASHSFVDSTACDIVYCAAQSAAYCVWRDRFFYSFTPTMYTFYCKYETVAHRCFTNSPEKKYYHNVPASCEHTFYGLRI